ncbi:hypothetical protein ESB13_12575 [Filimonas effusa]|uniref:Heme-binding HmuY-like protein n=1 Tax=Filimonas effusa TaxID=2508721 RepID=A0A4Q1D5X3_9BACT|nr:hypothetical protein ESB13_12575 [Filimonas effusa]
MSCVLRPLLFTCVGILLLVACKKDDVAPSLEDGKSTVVKDLAGDTLASIGDPPAGSVKEKRSFQLFTFRLSDRKQQFVKDAADSAAYLKNADWDLAFTNEYNSLVAINNGTATGTPGYGGPGQGAMVVIEKYYDQVTEAPSDEVFNGSGITAAGWDAGNGNGWYFYSRQNHICVPIKGRTFVIRTAAGLYAKLELVNIYLGNPPQVTNLFWPAPYLTFRYYVAEDGSRNLSTR